MTSATLNKLLWCLKRPYMYPEVLRHFKGRVANKFDRRTALDEMHEAEKHCEGICVDTKTALETITGGSSFVPITEEFCEELDSARLRTDSCPVRMGGSANLDLLFRLAEYVGAARVIETGVAYGWSSLALLLSMRNRENSLLISTDRPMPGTDSERFTGCVVTDDLKRGWKLLRRPDREALPVALQIAPTVDLCHYDSDKTREGRLWAYPQLWQAQRPGGIFVSDDINDNLAFFEFCRTVGQEPIVVRTEQPTGDKYVGVLKKPAA